MQLTFCPFVLLFEFVLVCSQANSRDPDTFVCATVGRPNEYSNESDDPMCQAFETSKPTVLEFENSLSLPRLYVTFPLS